MARSSNWDDELVQKLIELYKEGKYSTKQIGDMLGFTKNAIVGKIHRLELNKLKISSNKNEKENIKNENTNDILEDPLKKVKDSKHISKNKEKHYLLEEIEYNMCVWPYGEENFTFCGKKVVPGRPYCKEHIEQAYLKFTKKPKHNISYQVAKLSSMVNK